MNDDKAFQNEVSAAISHIEYLAAAGIRIACDNADDRSALDAMPGIQAVFEAINEKAERLYNSLDRRSIEKAKVAAEA